MQSATHTTSSKARKLNSKAPASKNAFKKKLKTSSTAMMQSPLFKKARKGFGLKASQIGIVAGVAGTAYILWTQRAKIMSAIDSLGLKEAFAKYFGGDEGAHEESTSYSTSGSSKVSNSSDQPTESSAI